MKQRVRIKTDQIVVVQTILGLVGLVAGFSILDSGHARSLIYASVNSDCHY
jgi:hypothetical protein